MARTNRLLYNIRNITAETPARSSGVADTDDFIGTLSQRPIPNCVEGQFNETPSATLRTFTDDGAGNLSGAGVTGEVDYDTGQITLRATTGGQEVDDSTVALNFVGHDADPDERLDDPTGDGMANDDIYSEIIYPKRLLDEQGVFQVQMDPGLSTIPVILEGRIDESTPWVQIHSYTQSDMVSNESAAAVVQIFPQMRVRVAQIAGQPSALGPLSAWLAE